MHYFLTLLTILFSVSASAEIFTWEDKNGVTHFSESKPAYKAQITQIDLTSTTKSLPDNVIVASSIPLTEEDKLSQSLYVGKLSEFSQNTQTE